MAPIRPQGRSALEKRFLGLWRLIRGPEPVEQFRFHAVRRWRFDFAWPDQRIAVEVHGGTWSGGRHVRGGGFESDCEKARAAAEAGWRLFPFTAKQITTPELERLKALIEERQAV